jgi:hypothetical protein
MLVPVEVLPNVVDAVACVVAEEVDVPAAVAEDILDIVVAVAVLGSLPIGVCRPTLSSRYIQLTRE